jgi:hypothetical protein
MNYCVYNKDFNQFLQLTYSLSSLGGGKCHTKWISKFVYALAGPEHKSLPRIETVWPINVDTKDNPSDYFIFVYHHIETMNNSKNGMEDIVFVPINASDLPIFVEAVTMVELEEIK